MTYFISIANAETGETIKREMTPQEVKAYEADAERRNKKIEARLKAEAEAAAEKQAILDKLGISAEEAKLLLS